MRCGVVVVMVALAFGTQVALAQAPGESQPQPRDEKTVHGAFSVTLAATAGPMALGWILGGLGHGSDGAAGTIGVSLTAAGLVLGPSAGHWYVRDGFTTGLALRLGGVATAGAILLRWDSFSRPSDLEIAGLCTAAAAFGAGIVWDLVALPSAVRRYNREHAIMPVVTTSGVALAGTF